MTTSPPPRFGDVMGTLTRADNDWYSDPPEATEALLGAERFSGSSWDPACGRGTIPTILRSAGLSCFASDLVDRGFKGAAVLDFLNDEPEGCGEDVDNIICNPPFNLAQAFVDKALSIAAHKVAMLLPLTFLEGDKRARWRIGTPLARIRTFAWRISMPPGELLHAGQVKAEGGKKAFAWFIWEHGWQGPPHEIPLIKMKEAA